MKLRKYSYLILGAVFAGLACGCTSHLNSEQTLPVVSTTNIEKHFHSYAEVVGGSDAIVRAKLVRVIDNWRRPIDMENPESTEVEVVGLVFKVNEIYAGNVPTTRRITVGWPAYNVVKNGNRRVSRNEIDGVTFIKRRDLNKEFVFAATYIDDLAGYLMLSTGGIMKVDTKRRNRSRLGDSTFLVSASPDKNIFSELGIATTGDLQRQQFRLDTRMH